MTLKAAYFTLIGLGESAPITVGAHIRPAIARGQSLHVPWPGAGHNVQAWSGLLVAERAATAGMAYTPELGQEVQANGQRLGQLWRETLRYHKNIAYQYEVRQVRQAAEWFLVNSELL